MHVNLRQNGGLAQGYKKCERDCPSSSILDKHSPCHKGSLTRHKICKRRVTIEYVKADRHANGSRNRAIELRWWSDRNIVRLSLIERQSPIVRQGREGSKNSTTCRSIRIITVCGDFLHTIIHFSNNRINWPMFCCYFVLITRNNLLSAMQRYDLETEFELFDTLV